MVGMSSEEEQVPQASVSEAQLEVGLQRSVRYGRVIIGGVVLGAIVGAIASLLFPVRDDIAYIDYTMGQMVGLMAVVGAAIGLLVGGIVALVLTLAARKRRGGAIAVLTDVR